jgi:predicted transcriptional regulator
LRPEISESLWIFHQREIELSVIMTKALFVRRKDRLRDSIKRYKNRKNTPTKTLKKKTKIFNHVISPKSTEITARGIPITFIAARKSLSIESFTSSGLIHL